jgi:hypothetical protein
MEKPLTYLAIPYSHPDPEVRLNRFRLANRFAAILLSKGKLIYSPISHTHPIAVEGNLDALSGNPIWIELDSAFLRCSREVVVATIDGWQQSRGVTAEIKLAEELGIPIHYMSQQEIEALAKA